MEAAWVPAATQLPPATITATPQQQQPAAVGGVWGCTHACAHQQTLSSTRPTHLSSSSPSSLISFPTNHTPFRLLPHCCCLLCETTHTHLISHPDQHNAFTHLQPFTPAHSYTHTLNTCTHVDTHTHTRDHSRTHTQTVTPTHSLARASGEDDDEDGGPTKRARADNGAAVPPPPPPPQQPLAPAAPYGMPPGPYGMPPPGMPGRPGMPPPHMWVRVRVRVCGCVRFADGFVFVFMIWVCTPLLPPGFGGQHSVLCCADIVCRCTSTHAVRR